MVVILKNIVIFALISFAVAPYVVCHSEQVDVGIFSWVHKHVVSTKV